MEEVGVVLQRRGRRLQTDAPGVGWPIRSCAQAGAAAKIARPAESPAPRAMEAAVPPASSGRDCPSPSESSP